MKFDVIIIGGGLSGLTAGNTLIRGGLDVAIISGGLSYHKTPRTEFTRGGGTFLLGDTVTDGVFEGDTLSLVHTKNLGQSPLVAGNYILATGKFASGGLVSTPDKIYEPLFGCDVQYDPDRSRWCDPDFFAPQPFEKFGVITDGTGRVRIGGRTISNLFAVGEILRGEVDITQSALDVCRQIL